MEIPMNRSKIEKKYYICAFLFGSLPFMISAASFTAQNGFVFCHYGDYDLQQIPFFIYTSRNIRQGILPQFDFYSGAGVDYITAYTFYNLFSPFNFLYALFPDSAVMAANEFIIAIKFGTAALTAFIYVSRSCKHPDNALTGAVLYAYSGAVMVNLVLPYLDAMALFPLLPTALESAVVDKRRGVFGAAVFICALTQYYIFGIEAVFLIIYFLVRLTDKTFRITLKDFFCLAAETVLGLMASGIALVPSAVYILNSPRTGEGFSSIKEMLLYETPWRYPRIIQSIFMLPELQGYTSIFPDFKGGYPFGSRWSSQAMYVPIFGVSGAIAYICANKKSWQTKLTLLCIIISFVPVLNSIFSMGSSIYYARWMFAPTLIMCAMTAAALENEAKYFKPGIIVHSAVLALIILFCLIFPIEKFTLWESNAYYNHIQKWTLILITAIGLIITYLLVFRTKRNETYPKFVLVVAVAFAFAVSESEVLFGLGDTPSSEMYNNSYYDSSTFPEIEKTDLGRKLSLSDDIYLNMNILWREYSSYVFTSVQSPYVARYCSAKDILYDDLNDDYPSKCLLSVEYNVKYCPDSEVDNAADPQGGDNGSYPTFVPYKKYGNYDIKRNTNYIPMGFCYNYCISDEKLLSLDKEVRERIMLKVMAVEDVSAVSDYLDPVPEEELYVLDDEEFAEECDKRAEKTVSGYYTDDDSYNAETDFSEPELVFFSVAYDEGFTAYVDGEEVPIIKANFGFQAIPVPAGKHTIKCVYHSKWRDIGAVSSAAGISGLIIYSAVCLIIRRKKNV